jgi:Fur family peroxide stress response transcriptional regulator
MENNIKQMLIDNGLRCTPQRLAVYQVLYESHTHPTADEIFYKTQSILPSISLASIYNTLETFVSKGIVKTMQTEGDTQRYDAKIHKHHHLFDTESGSITDYHDDNLTLTIENYFREKGIPGFDIQDVVVNIKGKYRR